MSPRYHVAIQVNYLAAAAIVSASPPDQIGHEAAGPPCAIGVVRQPNTTQGVTREVDRLGRFDDRRDKSFETKRSKQRRPTRASGDLAAEEGSTQTVEPGCRRRLSAREFVASCPTGGASRLGTPPGGVGGMYPSRRVPGDVTITSPDGFPADGVCFGGRVTREVRMFSGSGYVTRHHERARETQ